MPFHVAEEYRYSKPVSTVQAERHGAKVVHVTSVHTACDIRIYHKECRSLSDARYDVVLIQPRGQIECAGVVTIRTVPIARSRLDRLSRVLWKAFLAALREAADVYHIHDPELIPLGIALRLAGKHVIYDVHEDLPRQIMAKHWIPILLRPVVSLAGKALNALAASVFSYIVAATPAIAAQFPARKTILVRNYPIAEELVDSESEPYNRRCANVVYVGGITASRGILEMTEAMCLLPSYLSAELQLVGTFQPSHLKDEITRHRGWSRVRHYGWQSRQGVADVVNRARIGLVTLLPTPNHLESLPIKLFEYMSVGIPVIASDFPLWRRIVKEAGCGLVVDPTDPQEIADAIRWLLEHPESAEEMGCRGRAAVAMELNWGREARKLIAMYDNLLL